jgi:hypothetical protein
MIAVTQTKKVRTPFQPSRLAARRQDESVLREVMRADIEPHQLNGRYMLHVV